MDNIVLVGRDYLLFLQNMGVSDKHKHDICHLTISLDGKMHCRIEEEIVDVYGYLLNSNVNHQRFGENADSLKLVFVLDPRFSFNLFSKSGILYKKNYIELQEKQYRKILELCKLEYEKLKKVKDWSTYVQTNEKGRERDERDSFGGILIRMAKEYGVDASAVKHVYQML